MISSHANKYTGISVTELDFTFVEWVHDSFDGVDLRIVRLTSENIDNLVQRLDRVIIQSGK